MQSARVARRVATIGDRGGSGPLGVEGTPGTHAANGYTLPQLSMLSRSLSYLSSHLFNHKGVSANEKGNAARRYTIY